MAHNSYLGMARISSHPAFSWTAAALVCPICGATHTRAGDYDRDFLAHNPDAEIAWRRLSGRTYQRHAARRGWPSFDEALERFGD